MDNKALQSYKNQLLDAGIPYARVRKNLRELRDHQCDLQQQAIANGLSKEEAIATASFQLGKPEQLVTAMLERSELRSKLHRFPVSMTILLPLFAHFIICVFLLFAVLFPAIGLGSIDFVDGAEAQASWLVNGFKILSVTLMYIMTPLLGCLFAFLSIRNHVPKRFWLTGLVLLCLLGSSMQVHTDWGDPATGRQGSVNVAYFPGFQQSFEEMALHYTLRLTANLILCGCFAWHYRRREQATGVYGTLL